MKQYCTSASHDGRIYMTLLLPSIPYKFRATPSSSHCQITLAFIITGNSRMIIQFDELRRYERGRQGSFLFGQFEAHDESFAASCRVPVVFPPKSRADVSINQRIHYSILYRFTVRSYSFFCVSSSYRDRHLRGHTHTSTQIAHAVVERTQHVLAHLADHPSCAGNVHLHNGAEHEKLIQWYTHFPQTGLHERHIIASLHLRYTELTLSSRAAAPPAKLATTLLLPPSPPQTDAPTQQHRTGNIKQGQHPQTLVHFPVASKTPSAAPTHRIPLPATIPHPPPAITLARIDRTSPSAHLPQYEHAHRNARCNHGHDRSSRANAMLSSTRA